VYQHLRRLAKHKDVDRLKDHVAAHGAKAYRFENLKPKGSGGKDILDNC